MPIPVVMLSNAKVCGCSSVGIAASNPTQDIDVRLFCLLRVVYVAASATEWSLVRGSPIRYVCLTVCDLETSTMRCLLRHNKYT